ncbi:MAG: serine protease [Xanthobacteraceae bacterium]|jgi:trypsin-like peptidase
MRIRKARIVLGLLAAAALSLLAVPSVAKTAAKKPAVAAKPASDDPDSAVDTIGPPSQGALQAAGWRIIDDLVTGARLGLPSALVPKTALARMGSRWTSRQGQIDIETFRLHEGALTALFDDEKKVRRRIVEHSTLTPDSFVMSGMQGLKRFIVRVQSSGSELRGVTILFDRATEGVMAPIAAAMANSYQGFPDPGAAPPPGLRRSVEYGTAIVVSGQGHLITSAQIADGCQAITIPGFGHAERIAADKANDVALLRIYGAPDLLPVPLDGDSSAGDDITLVGVADPLAQAGGGAVTRAPAHRNAQGLDPAPKLGFSGAAAIDAQGRFAGMVDLSSTAVAGAGAVNQPTLIPVETLRNFLQAQGITPPSGGNAIDQSVVRVICVRK